MDPLTAGLCIGATIILGWLLGRRNKVDEVWHALGIANKQGKTLKLKSREKLTGKTTFKITVPDGIDMGKLMPGGKWHYAVLQSIGNMKLTEMSAINGHLLAVTVYDGELADDIKFKFEPGEPLCIPIGESLKGVVYLKLGDSASGCGIGGVPGAGKSTMLRIITAWLILHGVQLHLIDLKGGIEQKLFKDCGPVLTFSRSVPEARAAIKLLADEMERRLNLLFESNVQHYTEINLPPVVLIIDEFADMEGCDEALDMLTELGRKGRAAGVFTIPATQRPESKVMKGSYKSVVPAWLCFRMRDYYNSQIVLGHGGAEKLPGRGRCIFLSDAGEVELQGYYLSPKACKELIKDTYVHKDEVILDTSGVL